MKLLIVESPSKAKTIESYLGEDYKVLSSVGHIRDLETSGSEGLGIDIENGFIPKYKNIRGKAKVINEIKKNAKKSDFVYIATDPDREGESIGYHIAEILELDLDLTNRIIFNEITKSGILSGIDNPQKLDLNMIKSQETRRMLDRIMGFRLSKLLQKKIKSKSAGRVQSVALEIIVDRDKEIESFIPVEFYKLYANIDDLKLEYILNDKKLKKEELENVYEKCLLNDELELIDIKEKSKKQNPYLPYITSTFQQDIINKLSYSSKRAMMIAQRLYEGIEINGQLEGLITYMRTDSTRLSNDFVAETKEFITKEYGSEYLGTYRQTKKKNAQDAHEAIRPTKLSNSPESLKQFLSKEEYLVYNLIYKRTVASIMSSAIIQTNSYIFVNDGVEFKTNTTSLLFDGYKKVYSEDEEYFSLDYKVGDRFKKVNYDFEKNFTKPKARYNEASLIKKLESEGIGRPSTYASIIDILLKRNYVEVDKKKFISTKEGRLVVNKLKEFFSDIINIKYTSNMEKDLDEIALGNINNIDILTEFNDEFSNLIKNANEKMEKIEDEKTGYLCPECNSDLVYRKGRSGTFIGCSDFPKCRYIKTLEENIIGDCPICSEGKMIERKTKRGKIFYACNAFPKCKYAVWNKDDIYSKSSFDKYQEELKK